MKKLLLAVVTFFSLGILWLVPAQANAASVEVTSKMGGNGHTCEDPGYINPGGLSFAYNDRVTIKFVNQQDTRLQIRNIPGGTFTIDAHDTAIRSFQAKGNFVYAAWDTESNCEKAAARVEVSGGWWIRLWPWLLALVGSVIVVVIVGRAGQHQATPKSKD